MNVHYTTEEWRAIFSQRIQSGLSVRKWCDRNNFKYDTYKYWEKKIRILDAETGTNAGQFPAFAELPVQLGAGTWTLDAPTMQIHYHDFCIDIHSHTDMEQLSGALRLLQALC